MLSSYGKLAICFLVGKLKRGQTNDLSQEPFFTEALTGHDLQALQRILTCDMF